MCVSHSWKTGGGKWGKEKKKVKAEWILSETKENYWKIMRKVIAY